MLSQELATRACNENRKKQSCFLKDESRRSFLYGRLFVTTRHNRKVKNYEVSSHVLFIDSFFDSENKAC